MKIGHIALSVSNIDRSTGFYRKNFGFKCSKKYWLKSLGLKICIIKKDNVALELFEFKKHKPLPKYRKNLESDLVTLGTKHFAFAVEDIERTYKKLKKSSVRFMTDMRVFENSLKFFFIKDPDGILVEIMEEETGGRL